MILRVVQAHIAGPHIVEVAFNDGRRKKVNLRPLLGRGVFAPLLSIEYFSQMTFDPIAGTIVWPNGADFAPEAIAALPAIEERMAG